MNQAGAVQNERPFGVVAPATVMLRALPLARTRAADMLLHIARECGPAVTIPGISPDVVLATNPHTVKHLLVAKAAHLSKDTPQYTALGGLTGAALLTSDGDTWSTGRRALNPSFGKLTNTRTAAVAFERGRHLVTRWDAAGSRPFNAEEQSLHTGMDVLIGGLLWPGDNTDPRVADLHRSLEAVIGAVLQGLRGVVRSVQLPLPPWIPLGPRGQIRAACAAIDEVVVPLLRDALQAPERSAVRQLGEAVASGAMSSEQARNELVTLIIAGHETVACSMTWTLALLASAPHTFVGLHDEARAVLGGAEISPRTCPYTWAVMGESLRLYPPAWVVSRRALQTIETPEGNIRRGSIIIISPFVMGRDPQYWDNCDDFVPARFEGGLPRELRPSWIPFGWGKRLCIGKDMAMFEQAGILLGMALTRRPVPTSTWRIPRAMSEVTLRPDGGLPLTFERLR